jgi:hypothetical protein
MVILNKVKDLVTAEKYKILRSAQNDIIQVFACQSDSTFGYSLPKIFPGGFTIA